MQRAFYQKVKKPKIQLSNFMINLDKVDEKQNEDYNINKDLSQEERERELSQKEIAARLALIPTADYTTRAWKAQTKDKPVIESDGHRAFTNLG